MRVFLRSWFSAATLLLLLSATASAQKAAPTASGFTLQASPVAVIDANEVECIITNEPMHCVMAFNSPAGTGLFWPAGTVDGYIHSAGPQIFGVIPRSPACTGSARESGRDAGCFPWAGDTTGAFFFDHSGIRSHGRPLSEIYVSTDSADVAEWPRSLPGFAMADGIISDTTIFHPSLVGRIAASDQDTWSAYWDGDPARANGRTHPLGVLVEQRTMAWRAPRGTEATIFFVYEVTNVTHTAEFQRLNEERFFDGANALPDGGWPLDSLYFGYAWDPDVAEFGSNILTTIPSLHTMFAYVMDFHEPSWEYPRAQFHAPFFPTSPGLVGASFLRTPHDRGAISVNAHTGGGAFPAPNTIARAWRLARIAPDPLQGDPACMFQDPLRVRSCALLQTESDTRGTMHTGPFRLEPGQSRTVVMALTVAAAVATPAIQTTNGSQNRPGLPAPAPGCNGEPVRPIEEAAGWLAGACPADSFSLTDPETIEGVPASLVGKTLVAQELAARRFLTPAAPHEPPFFLVPGNRRITVVWEPSPTTEAGDPFAAAAADADGLLHDPNFRANDVEGYRIYRGTHPDRLELIAELDRSDSRFTDHLCVTDPAHITGTPCNSVREIPINGFFVQYRRTIEDGSPLHVDVDSAFAGRPLADTGVPFAYVDTTVHNGVTYFYRVTAFDVNSIRSGPSTLESSADVKSTQPRAAATSLTDAVVEVGLRGRSGFLTAVATPTIDGATGRFSGPQPPTTQLQGTFTEFAAQVLRAGATEIRIDSVVPAYYFGGTIATYHLSVDGAHESITFSNATVGVVGGGSEQETHELPLLVMEADPTTRAELQERGVDAPGLAGSLHASISVELPHWNSLQSDWAFKQPGMWLFDPPNTLAGGSRWFSGANESMPDPTLATDAHGRLEGITAIFQPTPYRQLNDPSAPAAMARYRNLSPDVFRRFLSTVFGVTRGADVRLYWGNARLDSVVDITHDVTVPFSSALRASYGFVGDNDGDGAITYGDFYWLDGLYSEVPIETNQFAVNRRPLLQQPVVMQVDATGDLIAEGTGFALYINGEPFIFRGPVPTGTVWTLRTYDGVVTRDSTGYEFEATAGGAPIPGLRFSVVVEQPARIIAEEADLARIHTVPDPYYGTSAFDRADQFRELHFVNLPAAATIRIYTVSGVLVDVLVHDDPAGGGKVAWDLRGRGNNYVRSGVYLYHVSTPDGKSHVGKFTVVNTAH